MAVIFRPTSHGSHLTIHWLEKTPLGSTALQHRNAVRPRLYKIRLMSSCSCSTNQPCANSRYRTHVIFDPVKNNCPWTSNSNVGTKLLTLGMFHSCLNESLGFSLTQIRKLCRFTRFNRWNVAPSLKINLLVIVSLLSTFSRNSEQMPYRFNLSVGFSCCTVCNEYVQRWKRFQMSSSGYF